MTTAQPATSAARAWLRFRVEMMLVRNYNLFYAVSGYGAAGKNPVLETMLPSLFYMRMVSLLDDALEDSLTSRGIRSGTSLNSRIQALRDVGCLSASSALDEVRRFRNSLAHDAGTSASWQQLDEACTSVSATLESLGVAVDARPLEAKFSRTPDFAPTEAGVEFVQHYRVWVESAGVVLAEQAWSTKFYSPGDSGSSVTPQSTQ